MTMSQWDRGDSVNSKGGGRDCVCVCHAEDGSEQVVCHTKDYLVLRFKPAPHSFLNA
jgi:hypothetical protein